MLAEKLAGSGLVKTYIEDVFSAYLASSVTNGASITINNGIDMTKEGLIVSKVRSGTDGTDGWRWNDTVRGITNQIQSNTTAAQTSGYTLTTNSSGFVDQRGWNAGNNIAYWTFRKAPKFFDVVTWTGNGTTQSINHSLNQAVGCAIVKCTSSATTDWMVWHKDIPTYRQRLNATTAAVTDSTAKNYFGDNVTTVNPTSSTLTVGSRGEMNTSGATYVAYLFAHDTSTDGLIQCGSFTTDGAGAVPTTTLGWEPQFLLYKASSSASAWNMVDTARGWQMGSPQETQLYANTSGAESTAGTISPTATGFARSESGSTLSANTTYVYIAIRRGPMKPPTSGTQVYQAIARTGTGAAATVTGVGFPPDLVFSKSRATSNTSFGWYDRLRGALKLLQSATTDAEYGSGTDNLTGFDVMDGVKVGADTSTILINQSTATYINYFLRRYPGVFAICAYTGTGSARTVAHNLGVVPELLIVKARTSPTANAWFVYSSALGATKYLLMNSTNAPASSSTVWNNAGPTATTFTVATSSGTNDASGTYVAYLFATLPGISKVGSYTGNGGTQTIDCGFAAGARFVLIKRTDSTGDWFVWDTVRGIVAANDPHLSLNTTAAEVTTDDSIDPDPSGFIVNQLAATNINVSGATYIYLALA